MHDYLTLATIRKATDHATDARVEGSSRAWLEDYYRSAYESTGAKSYDLRLDGKKYGTASVVTTKASSKQVSKLNILHWDEFVVWLLSDGTDYIKQLITDSKVMPKLEKLIASAGEVPEGAMLVTETVETPETIKYVAIRPDFAAIIEGFGPQLPDTVAGLLEAGDVE